MSCRSMALERPVRWPMGTEHRNRRRRAVNGAGEGDADPCYCEHTGADLRRV